MFDIIQVERGEYFIKILLFDKIAKFNSGLITVYGDAHLEGKANFLAELARIYHDKSSTMFSRWEF